MTAAAVTAFIALAAYLVGAIPFGYLVARSRGVDIFREGSGNIGATNVGRVLGKHFGILVFLLDFAKGAVPAAAAPWFANLLGPSPPSGLSPDDLGVCAGLAAFLGHLFPIYLRFHGGKGVATGAGVIAVLVPGPALAALLVWVACVCALRYVSLASLAAATVLCISRFLTPAPLASENRTLTLFCLLAAALVAIRHRTNIVRLLYGNEHRLRNSPAMLSLTKILHLFALGIWFGTLFFFTFVVGLSLVNTFDSLGNQTKRPVWFPLAREFAREDPQLNGPTEQATRVFGYAVGPLFQWYFLLQVVCGLLAAATALNWSWSLPQPGLHKARSLILLAALATVVVGWPVERKVSELRKSRDQAVDTFLQSNPDKLADARTAALEAKATFNLWHGVSLLLNFLALALVVVAVAFAAFLPSAGSPIASGQQAVGRRQ